MARLDRSGETGNRLHDKTPEPSPDHILPDVSRDLIEYLERRFPEALPTNTFVHDEIVVEVAKGWGRREVLEHLKEVHREIENQNANVLLKSKPAAAGAGSHSTGPAAR